MDIIPAHPVSAFTAENRALYSAGGHARAAGMSNVHRMDIIPVHPVSAFTAENRALYSAGGHARAAGMSHMAV